MERVKFLKPFGAPRVRQFCLILLHRRRRRRKLTPRVGRLRHPNFIFHVFIRSPPPKAAVSQMGAGGAPTGAPKAPKGGAEGATPPEGEGNPAEGGYFVGI